MTNNFSRIAVLTLLTSTTAFAQPTEGTAKSDVAPISNALEIAIGGGYMQGVGDIGDGMASVQDLSRAGGGGELQIAYRLSPQLALGGYTTLSSFTTGSQVAPTSDLVLGMTAGAKGDWHFRPATALDPWVSLGAGWRSMWIGNDDATEQTLHAIDVARLQVGLDYRITPSIALTPYAGASASVFFAKDTTMTSSYEEITGKTVSFAFTGGLMGRFDMFGSRGR